MADALFEEWRAYQKLVENDYMYHRSFFGRLKDEIRQCFARPVSILDIGCGDASPILPMLEALKPGLYCGADQSETALSMAKMSLASLDIPSHLFPGDLLETLPTLNGSFDVVVASFCFHHLETAEIKQKVLAECRRLLHPEGLLAVIDVFHEEGETRAEYLQRWVGFAQQSYTALNPAEMTLLVDHARSLDFPETLSTYRSLGRAAGFDQFDVLLVDKENFNHLVTLKARAAA
jgi:ubiquinone/menaquinone biosynthesis C-methylase UbiE